MKPVLYEVGAAARFTRLADALSQWGVDAPADAIVEIIDSATYAECISVTLKKGQALELRAATRQRPTIRLGMSVSGEADSEFQLEGLTVTGCTVRAGQPAPGNRVHPPGTSGLHPLLLRCARIAHAATS